MASKKLDSHRSCCYLLEEPPSFIDFGIGIRVKIIDGNYDHPLTRKGVTVSKST
jgi:hypothetical protein